MTVNGFPPSWCRFILWLFLPADVCLPQSLSNRLVRRTFNTCLSYKSSAVFFLYTFLDNGRNIDRNVGNIKIIKFAK